MPYRLLLDTSSLMYRTFFAFPPLIADQAAKEVGLRECQQKCAVKVSPTVVTHGFF